MPVKIESGQTILFIGDSITDCGRREGTPPPPLGNGFVKMFNDMLVVREPDKKIIVINRGINGDRVNGGLAHIPNSGLTTRWDTDVIDLKPDWLTLLIGINDVHSNFDPRFEAVTPEVFEQVYDGLLDKTVKALPACKIMLMEPFLMVGTEPLDEVRQKVIKVLPKYQRIIRKMSIKYGTRFVRTHRIMNKLVKARGLAAIGQETVHPNSTGHFAIAEAVYKALSR